MNSEQNLTREEAIAILNTPDEQLNELIERAGALRKKYKGNHVSIHLLTNARSGNCIPELCLLRTILSFPCRY